MAVQCKSWQALGWGGGGGGNCSEGWQRRGPWGNQTQLLNVGYLVLFLLPTSL